MKQNIIDNSLIFNNKNDYIRFWSKVNVLGENDCWEWKLSLDPDGYGRFRLNGKKRGSHRVSYANAFGEIPYGKIICHSCNNPPCVNPNHLYAGTQKDNTRDSIDAGTLWFSKAYGEKCPNAKLSNKDVYIIRDMLNKGISVKEISKKYNITDGAIYSIKNKTRWKKV